MIKEMEAIVDSLMEKEQMVPEKGRRVVLAPVIEFVEETARNQQRHQVGRLSLRVVRDPSICSARELERLLFHGSSR